MYFICYRGSVQRTLNYIWKNHVKLQPKQLLMQFVNVFLSILLKCLKCHLKKTALSDTWNKLEKINGKNGNCL